MCRACIFRPHTGAGQIGAPPRAHSPAASLSSGHIRPSARGGGRADIFGVQRCQVFQRVEVSCGAGCSRSRWRPRACQRADTTPPASSRSRPSSCSRWPGVPSCSIARRRVATTRHPIRSVPLGCAVASSRRGVVPICRRLRLARLPSFLHGLPAEEAWRADPASRKAGNHTSAAPRRRIPDRRTPAKPQRPEHDTDRRHTPRPREPWRQPVSGNAGGHSGQAGGRAQTSRCDISHIVRPCARRGVARIHGAA